MTGYGFGKRLPKDGDKGAADERIDLSGIRRTPVAVDPALEEQALRRGAQLGFTDRGDTAPARVVRRRRETVPQTSIYVKGPKDVLDWFIEYTNEHGNRSYWETLAQFRRMVDGE